MSDPMLSGAARPSGCGLLRLETPPSMLEARGLRRARGFRENALCVAKLL